MRWTITTEDRMVTIDGVSVEYRQIQDIDPNIRAVQWYGERGFIEYFVGPQKWIGDATPFETIIDRFADEQAAEENRRIIEQRGPVDFRETTVTGGT